MLLILTDCVCVQISLSTLARMCGYGNNPHRVRNLFNVKKNSKSVSDLLSNPAVAPVSKTRKDKISGDPFFTRAWHHFMAVKKGQSFRCNIVKTERKKDPVSKKWVWHTEWARHQKRFMSMTISEFRTKLLTWEPYLEWRSGYLAKNPKLPSSWQVGEGRLYKEKCFCGWAWKKQRGRPMTEAVFSKLSEAKRCSRCVVRTVT